MIIACICGGSVELSVFIGACVAAWLTCCYNRYKCRKHHCQPNCDRSKKSE